MRQKLLCNIAGLFAEKVELCKATLLVHPLESSNYPTDIKYRNAVSTYLERYGKEM